MLGILTKKKISEINNEKLLNDNNDPNTLCFCNVHQVRKGDVLFVAWCCREFVYMSRHLRGYVTFEREFCRIPQQHKKQTVDIETSHRIMTIVLHVTVISH